MKRKPFTVNELADQLRAQGRVILMLVHERDQRSKVEQANNVARIMSEEGRADLVETARREHYGGRVVDLADYPDAVPNRSIEQIIRDDNDRVIKNVSMIVGSAIKCLDNRTGPVREEDDLDDTGEYCSHCGHPL